ncbi:hypothetical protein D3C72_2131270 [compost metagenome]
MKLLSSDARNSAAFANSSGRPRRPSGISPASCFSNAPNCASPMPILPMIGVSTGPGLRQLTRMLRPLSSAAQLRAKERTAALVAA